MQKNGATLLTIGQIRRDGGTQTRAHLDAMWVADLAEWLADETYNLDPVDVYFDGRAYWLTDGFHRVDAYEMAGREIVPCNVHQGTLRDAILHSVGANSKHGKNRTNDDKRRAVLKLLTDEEWSAKSDRWIADMCRVSHTFVNDIRRESTGNVASSPTRLGADGKTRRLPERKPDTRLAPQLEPEPEDLAEDFDEPETEPTEPGHEEPASPPKSAPRQEAPEQPPPDTTDSAPAAVDLLTAWDAADPETRAELLAHAGLVEVAALESLRAQREDDSEYSRFREVEKQVTLRLGTNRAQRMIDCALHGGDLALIRLGLDYSVTKESLNSAYRARASKCHPDHGHDPAVMARLNADRALVLALLEGGQPLAKQA